MVMNPPQKVPISVILGAKAYLLPPPPHVLNHNSETLYRKGLSKEKEFNGPSFINMRDYIC